MKPVLACKTILETRRVNFYAELDDTVLKFRLVSVVGIITLSFMKYPCNVNALWKLLLRSL